jgi:proline iminopeptidase
VTLPEPTSLYPPIEPRQVLSLPVPGGHRLHVEDCGHPEGVPVLFLHGGPGSATKPDHRRYFDPRHYRVVLFDQRGCGRSTPLGGVDCNTTAHLIDDIERIRNHLGVSRWVLFGGSWGSTLALAYAQAHPDRVRALILRGIFLASRAELDWYFTGLRQFLPEAREALFRVAPGHSWERLVACYETLLNSADQEQARRAAADWNAYESAIMSIGDNAAPMSGVADDAALARARVQIHYLARACFLRDGELLDNLPRIAHLPAILLHGRQDFVCPPVTAWELARRWPRARLSFVEQARHAASHPALERALVAAADEMLQRLAAAE